MRGIIVRKLKSFKDKRGEFVEIWKQEEFDQIGFWMEDDYTLNRKGTLRGLHGDGQTWKLLSCIFGEIFFAAVNLTTKEHKEIILSGENHLQVEASPDYAIGYQALSNNAIIHYKQSLKYGGTTQFTLPWDGFNIPWPIKKPILSERDRNA